MATRRSRNGRPTRPEVAARRAKIAALAKAGLTRREIAEKVGVSYDTARGVLIELGIEVRRQPMAPRPKRVRMDAAITKLAAQGLTIRQVAQRLKKNYITMCGHVRRLGLKLTKEPKVISQPDYANVVKLLRSGATYNEIAERYGVTKQAIHLIAKKNGIRRAPPRS